MKKNISGIVWLGMLMPLIYLAIILKSVRATVAMHFNIQGDIDRYGAKNELLIAIAALTGVNILVYLLLRNIYRIDPRKSAPQNKNVCRKLQYLYLFLSAVFILITRSAETRQLAFS